MAYGRGLVADVLIVEDDAMIRTSLVRALSARDHSTMTAPNAWEGLQSLVAHRPDVVLLDLGLPDLDGASLLAMIRAVSDVPVIVVSARDDGAGIVAAAGRRRRRLPRQAVRRRPARRADPRGAAPRRPGPGARARSSSASSAIDVRVPHRGARGQRRSS